LVTNSIGWFARSSVGVGGDLLLQKSIALDLGVDSSKFHVFVHVVMLLRANWSELMHSIIEDLVLQIAQSSANSEYFMLDVLNMSFIITKNSSGLRTEPCGTPAVTGCCVDSVFCNLTWIRRCCRNSLTNFCILPVSPRFSSFWRRPPCHTESNALVKSKKTATVGFSRMSPSLMSDSSRVRASWVECRVRKPLWLGSMSDVRSRWHLRRWLTIFSNSLHRLFVSAMGRYDEGFVGGLLGFRKGSMCAACHW